LVETTREKRINYFENKNNDEYDKDINAIIDDIEGGNNSDDDIDGKKIKK
jgi:hypothetical protein